MSAQPIDLMALRERATARVTHPLSRTLVILTFVTGIIDAVSYLGLGHVFTANMTGNIVFLGFGIAGAGGLPVVAPIVSLVAFFVGAGCGSVAARHLAERHRVVIETTLGLETLLVAGSAIIAAAVSVRPGTAVADTIIALLAFALGARNAMSRRLGVPDLTTTVVTTTLAGLAGELPLFGGEGKGTARRLSSVLAMLVGAIAGALLLQTSAWLALAVAAALTLLASRLYVTAARRGRL